jgi:hypothetical protein
VAKFVFRECLFSESSQRFVKMSDSDNEDVPIYQDLGDDGQSTDPELEPSETELIFCVNMLENHTVVFRKSELPEVKIDKKGAYAEMAHTYNTYFNKKLTPDQMRKTVNLLYMGLKKTVDVWESTRPLPMQLPMLLPYQRTFIRLWNTSSDKDGPV